MKYCTGSFKDNLANNYLTRSALDFDAQAQEEAYFKDDATPASDVFEGLPIGYSKVYARSLCTYRTLE